MEVICSAVSPFKRELRYAKANGSFLAILDQCRFPCPFVGRRHFLVGSLSLQGLLERLIVSGR